MQNMTLLSTHEWSVGALWGSSHPFFSCNAGTIISTWIVLLFIVLLALAIRLFSHHLSAGSYMSFCALSYMRFLKNLCEQSMGSEAHKHLSFICALFTFLLLCNTASIFPGMEEPSADINTALALGVISFLYAQFLAIKHHGLWNYITGFFSPFFIMLPLNIVGKLSSVMSLSLRLFGNIFGGAMITGIYTTVIGSSTLLQIFGMLTGLNLLITLFFGIFEGTLQAFVFTMLTVTQISLAIQEGGGH